MKPKYAGIEKNCPHCKSNAFYVSEWEHYRGEFLYKFECRKCKKEFWIE